MNVALNVVLVPRLALTGSALATLAAYAFLHVALSVAARGSTKVPPPSRLLQLQLAGVAALALLSAGTAQTPLDLTIRAVIAAATVAWFLRVLVRIGKAPDNTAGSLNP